LKASNFLSYREEAEALKREKAEDEARIRSEEQAKYQEELKKQSLDAQLLLAELQQQQLELTKKQESLMYEAKTIRIISCVLCHYHFNTGK